MLAPRDIIRISVGMGEQPEGRRALEPLGKRSPVAGMDTYRLCFWIPIAEPALPKYARSGSCEPATVKRDETRHSAVPDVTTIELQRIRDGAIEEVVMEWECEKAAPEEWRNRACEQAWRNLAKNRATGWIPSRPLRIVSALPTGGQHGPNLIAARDFENRRLVVH